jgi:hypothetical protein
LVGEGNAWHFNPDTSSYSGGVFDGSVSAKKIVGLIRYNITIIWYGFTK